MRHTHPFLPVALLSLSLAYTQAEAPSLVLHWDFDAPLGSIEKDQTEKGYSAILKRGHGHHPAPSRHPESGRIGGAVKIESRSMVEATVPHPLGPSWTLSFWLKQAQVSRVDRGMVLPDIVLRFPDRRPNELRLCVKGLPDLVAPRITPAKWEHYCLVVRPGGAAVYLNGHLAAEKKLDGWAYPHASGKLHFGATNWHRMLLGLIDEVRLYQGALTEEVVRELALHAYHPKAEWIKAFEGGTQGLTHAGLLARHEAQAYQRLGAPSPEALLKVFKTAPPPAHRGDAAWALGVLKAPGAAQELMVALPGAEPAVQVRICQGLGALADPAATNSLCKALLHENSSVRVAAARALAALGNQGLTALFVALSVPRWEVLLASAAVLRENGCKPSEGTGDMLFAIALGDWRRVEQAGKAAAQALTAVLVMEDDAALLKDRHRSGEVSRRRSQAQKLLEKLGPDAVEALVSSLEQSDPERQKTAAGILRTIADPTAVPGLIELLKSPDHQVVAAGASALIPMKDAAAAPALRQVLAHPSSAVRQSAVEALGAIGQPAIESLTASLSDRAPLIREAAAEALGKTADKSAAPPLLKALTDPKWRVRARAAEALGRIAEPTATASLTRALKDPDWTVRALAAKALGQLGTDPALAALRSAAEDPHRLVRDQIRRSLTPPVAERSEAR